MQIKALFSNQSQSQGKSKLHVFFSCHNQNQCKSEHDFQISKIKFNTNQGFSIFRDKSMRFRGISISEPNKCKSGHFNHR